MIITRTPYRMSLFGGGTDYPGWYLKNGGAVFGFAINKYCYISVRKLPPFFEHKHRIVYSKIEMVTKLDEIEHPSVRAVLSEYGVNDGLEIHHDGDLPARSGLGSSSSFTVGLIHAIRALRGQISSQQELAKEAIRIEQDVVGESVGSQDQVWAAYGGIKKIDFHRDGGFSVSPVLLGSKRRGELTGHLMLFFTGFSRIAAKIAKEKIANLDQRARQLNRMRAMVDDAVSILCDPTADIRGIGELMHEGWTLKRQLAESVTTDEIDAIYRAGREAGAVGGKVLGAGGGGFLLMFVEPEKQASVRARLKDLVEVSVDIDQGGSSVVIYQPDGLGAQLVHSV
jgi:D-glycero-alpha-D-manno-heptose-7-phosphate kinase